MSAPAAARVNDMHYCPIPGSTPHVGGQILVPGCPTVFIGGQPAARLGDKAYCNGPPDTIIQGSTTVLIGGKPAARLGDQTAHGGKITSGSPDVFIGDLSSSATDTGTSEKNREEQNLEKLKWGKSVAQRDEVIKLYAQTRSVPDGMMAILQIWQTNEGGAPLFIDLVTAEVKNSAIEAEWQVQILPPFDDALDGEQEKKYKAPEYFFKLFVSNLISESESLSIKDWLELELIDVSGKPMPDQEYIIDLPDGQKRKGRLDSNGYAREENLPPGHCKVEFPNLT